ncbi:unnamed protein product [Closterium sp. Naga37s-1]|nr:unnamed protein product [Closterium sp. Naga37s-1]
MPLAESSRVPLSAPADHVVSDKGEDAAGREEWATSPVRQRSPRSVSSPGRRGRRDGSRDRADGADLGRDAPHAYPPLPWVPLIAGMEFVGAGGGAARAPYTPPCLVDADLPAAAAPLRLLNEGSFPRQVLVPSATLGQLWRLVEWLQALLLIQVNAYASLPRLPGNTLDPDPRADCIDAAAQLVFLVAPVVAAPARGGIAAVGWLEAAVQGLRRYLRAGTGADAIGAGALVVRELRRNLSGILSAIEADEM